jgi:hypothetical protein
MKTAQQSSFLAYDNFDSNIRIITTYYEHHVEVW